MRDFLKINSYGVYSVVLVPTIQQSESAVPVR